ncbi:valacyclovir hydrolase [Pyrenophora seminiperda CCB06]|uniref:Valacyclovir hydrolase n=1 Tax=Pyrenophora seminiperda CCB06 TaxID=1302712 RepID=A0A3M7M095_9PLEO|nr:valacyclovir hydrolase [Pyrenophora seminiperda CCB06]
MSNPSNLVLPRLGTPPSSTKIPISGPPESTFTSLFGALLPPAQYLSTSHGKAAYYTIPQSGALKSAPSDRVLFIHGVQTPALGMLPLARALHTLFPATEFVLLDLWGHGLSDTPILVVAEAVREWQMREHAGHVASVVAIVRDGGVMDNHDCFTKAVWTEIPSLVVLGEKDDVCTEQELRDLGFQDVFVVQQAGHGVVRERVPEVAGFIGSFWSKLGI